MTRRRTVLPLLVALLLGAIGWTFTSSAAHAGGPTSVLMTNPGLGRASALHVENPDYARLSAAVGDDVATGDLGAPGGLNPGAGQELRLTWLIHDMQIWRIDRLHLTGHDGIWVETIEDLTASGDVFDRPARWHRPKDDRTLVALLADAGLLGTDPTPSSPASPDSTADATAAPTTATSATPSQPAGAIVGAAIGGLAVGAAGSLLFRRRRTVDGPKVTLTG
jgi:hypothetical protein